VIVDPEYGRYRDFVRAASMSDLGLHFCDSGRAAIRLARRQRADAWLLATDLPDMSGFDLLETLLPLIKQADLDPVIARALAAPGLARTGGRSAVFMVSDAYRLDEEQRSLCAGVAGYLVRPVMPELLRDPHLATPRFRGG
jgi:DNA-binding response OmpR family regulator